MPQVGQQACNVLLEGIASSSSLLDFVSLATVLHENCRLALPQGSKNLLTQAKRLPTLTLQQMPLLSNFWEAVLQDRGANGPKKFANDARKSLQKSANVMMAQLIPPNANEAPISDTIDAERMSWHAILGTPQDGHASMAQGANIVTDANIAKWCMQKLVEETMSNAKLNTIFSWNNQPKDDDDADDFDAEIIVSNGTNSHNLWSSPTAIPIGADIFCRALNARRDMEVLFDTEQTPWNVDKDLIRKSASPPDENDFLAFAIQYGIHFMCIHARAADWKRHGNNTIFQPSRINQMSASNVLALARIDCPLPKSFLQGQMAVLDSTTELLLTQQPPIEYDILPYVMWKAVLCTPDAPPPIDVEEGSTCELFAPRQLWDEKQIAANDNVIRFKVRTASLNM